MDTNLGVGRGSRIIFLKFEIQKAINMTTQNPSTRFTPLQQELLKLFGREVSDEDLIVIRDLIRKYFLEKLQNKVDAGVKENGYSQQDFDSWLNDSGQ
jgi:hypothetical protein